MKRILSSILCSFLIVYIGSAQILSSVPSPQRLNVGSYAQGPALSPDGKRLAFSREQYNGVEVLDLESNKIENVCSHLGSGWGMTWLDAQTLVVRSIKEGTNFRNRQMGVEVIDVISKQETASVPFSAGNRIEVPHKSSSGSVAVWNNRHLSVISPDKSVLQKKAPRSGEALPSFEEGKILSGNKTLETPTRRAVLSMAWSPDGSKALVELHGQPSLYLMNRATGKFTVASASGERPTWINNTYFVFMETRDDGHQVVSGEIILASLDGRKQNLTEGVGGIAVNPTASQDGKIAFNTMEGELFLLKLTLP